MKAKIKSTDISVIVLVYNSARTIKECLDSLVKQQLVNSKYEINIVYRKSTDDTFKILQQYLNINIITQKNKGIPQARNLGIKRSRYNIIAFTDSDCILSPQWLSTIESNFQNDAKLAALSGPLKAYRENKRYVPLYYGVIGDAYGNVGQLATNNSAYRKQALKNIGNFDEKLITGEDVDLSWKLETGKYKIKFDKNLLAYHQYRNTFKEVLKEQYHYGIGRSLLIKRYPNKFSIFEKHIAILPYVLFLYLLLLFVFLFLSKPIFIVVLILGILTLLTFIFGRRYSIINKILKNEGVSITLKCLPLFFAIDYSNIRGIFSKK